MQRLLITGGCGFLGHHLVEHFLKNTSADIIVLDKLSYASNGYDRLRDIGAYDNSRVKVIGCDLARALPDGVIRELGVVDYVIHAAAETHVDNSIVDPLPFFESNVIGTHHLLWTFNARSTADRPHRIFLVSTDEVYGPASWDSPGNRESDPFRPANPYAAAKAGGEAIGMAYANTYQLPITIVNTMNLFGERQHAEKFIPLVIGKVLRGESVKIHADAKKARSGSRFYIHCRNYAAALHFLIKRDEARIAGYEPPLKIHVAGEREVSNLELAQKIAAILGRPLEYELVDFHSSRPGHDLRYALDDTSIRAMGFHVPVTIDQSLEKTVHWYLEHPQWLGINLRS